MQSRLYGILTDIAHILGGGLAGYISFFKPEASFLMFISYFVYQYFEHQEIEIDDFVGDLREFLIGLTIGLALALANYMLAR